MNYYAIVGLVAGIMSSSAAETAYRSMVITHRNTDEPSYLSISDGTEMRFEDNALVFTGATGELSARLDNIRHIGFSELPTTTLPEFPDYADSGPTTGVTLPSVVPSRMVIEGRVLTVAPAGEIVAVHDAAGRVVAAEVSHTGDGAATIDFSGSVPGLYIVTAGGTSVKIVVK